MNAISSHFRKLGEFFERKGSGGTILLDCRYREHAILFLSHEIPSGQGYEIARQKCPGRGMTALGWGQINLLLACNILDCNLYRAA